MKKSVRRGQNTPPIILVVVEVVVEEVVVEEVEVVAAVEAVVATDWSKKVIQSRTVIC
jgi:hypothetical protein